MKKTNMLIAAALVVAAAAPVALAVPEVALANGGTKNVAIKADASALEEIMADPAFKTTYAWLEIGWIGGTVGLAKYAELKARADLFVEDEVIWHLECHGGPPPHGDCGGGGGGGGARISDQIPYGIEQIYNSNTITATSGGAGVVLGHIDTGIDFDHLDLVNRIVYYDSDDKNGHGTHTAGTAAADAGSDGLGIYGVAPEASIRSYKVCNAFCNTNSINAAIQDCTGKCDVITFSIGGDAPSSSTLDAIAAFTSGGGIFVAAAGNDGSSLGSIDWPGASGMTVAVAAIDSSKTVASFSSRGSRDGCGGNDGEVEFAAAGVGVISTYKGGGYASMDGTSMATPHVAGLALKKWTGNGDSTRTALANGVEDITKGTHAKTGCDAASGRGLPHV